MNLFNKQISVVLLALLFAAATVGCENSILPQNNDVYTGPAKVAFKRPNPDPVELKGGTITKSYTVQLIRSKEGTLQSKPLNVFFNIVESETTAPAASYNIKTPSPVTIPLGSLETKITISFKTKAIPNGKAKKLTLYLKGNKKRGVASDSTVSTLNLLLENPK